MSTDPISRPSLADDAMSTNARSTAAAAREARRRSERVSSAVPVGQRKLATQQKAADHYDVTPRTVRNWISRGLITGYRLPGSRAVRVDLHEIDRVMGLIPTVAGEER